MISCECYRTTAVAILTGASEQRTASLRSETAATHCLGVSPPRTSLWMPPFTSIKDTSYLVPDFLIGQVFICSIMGPIIFPIMFRPWSRVD